MAENMIKFLRGNVANLPATATAGAVYFTKDEGLYLGLEDGTYHRYGDFITVNDVASLPADGAHETCMYYCVAENVLAKWNGSSWTQINKQKTLAELGGVAKSVYEAKIALLEKADTDNATAISDLGTYVGTIPEGATATNVVAYIQEKTAGIATDAALTELTGRVTTAEGDIDKLEASLAEGGDTYKAIAAAQSAADAAQADVDALEEKVGDVAEGKTVVGLIDDAQKQADKGVADAATAQARADEAYTLADGKATMTEVNDAIANAGHAVKADVDQAISDLDAAYKAADEALQGNIDKKVDQTAYDTKIAALEGADTTLQGNIDALADKVGEVPEDKTVVQMIADAQTAATYDDTQVKADIKANADAIDAIEADYLKKADKDGLQEQITANANAIELLTNGVSADEVDGVNDLINYVKEHGPEVTAMQEDIAANAKAISDQATSDAATYETKTDAAQKLADAKAYADGLDTAMNTRVEALEAIDHDHSNKTVLDGITAEKVAAWDASEQNAKDYTDGKIADLKIGDYAKQADLDAHTGDTVVHITADERTAWNASEQNAKDYADGLNTAMDARVVALEAVDHEHANKDVLDGITAAKVSAWDAAQANAEATAAAALATARTEISKEIDDDVKALADGAVKANTDAIAIINGADTQDGSIAKALKDAKAYADTAESDAVATANAYTDSALTWGSF